MITASSSASVLFVGRFLRESGYDTAHLSEQLGLGDGLYANHENLEPLLERTAGDSLLSVLARLFFVSWPVEDCLCQATLPREFLDAAFTCGLLQKDSGSIACSACIIPFRGYLISFDSSRNRVTHADFVMGPSASTLYPARIAIGGSNETTLDLGTGSGALALEATRYSRKVIGTDINDRALQFAKFNAVLNSVENVEWRCGDAFAPVAGERFTRIVANPPFFLSPEKAFVYCDSPMELDGFTARLACECSAYLKEGGYYQMICEWVEIENESWKQRLVDWTAEAGCDVLVLLSPQASNPVSYSEMRANAARFMRANGAEGHFAHQLRYLRAHNVKQVMSGVINMRKRTCKKNWFTIVQTDLVGHDLGPDVRARFDAFTFLLENTEHQILDSRLKLSPAVSIQMRAVSDPEGVGWNTTSLELVREQGITDRLKVDEVVSQFLPLFDGTRTVADIAALVARDAQVGEDEAARRCLELARRLLQSSFIMPRD